jgi:succinoglycan biosynthesis protein ExoO
VNRPIAWPLVSVVLAAYNADGFIERALRSVQRQTYANIEIIVIDDGSTDNTVAVVTRCAVADKRISLIRLDQNGGASVARNAGFDAAHGEWIAIIDADDAWESDRLQRLMTHAISNGVDIADNQLLFDQGSESVTRVGFCMETDYIDWTLLRHFKYNDPGSAFNLGLLKPVFRTAFLRKSGVRYNRNDRSGEDFVFYAELLIRGANADILSTPGYIYTFPVGELSSLPSAWRRSHVNLDMLIGVMTDLDDRYKGRLSASEHDALMRRLTKCRQLRTCKEIWNRLVN